MKLSLSLRGEAEAIHKQNKDSSLNAQSVETLKNAGAEKQKACFLISRRRQDFAMILWVVKRWAKGFT